jgi:hypothetical protein
LTRVVILIAAGFTQGTEIASLGRRFHINPMPNAIVRDFLRDHEVSWYEINSCAALDAFQHSLLGYFYESWTAGAQNGCVRPLPTQNGIHIKDQIKILLELHR